MGKTKEIVNTKRQRIKKAEDPSQRGKKRARQEDENNPTDADQDEPQTKKKKVERDVEGEPTKIRNKREKGQAGRTDVKPGEDRGATPPQAGKKRSRQDQDVQPSKGEPPPKKRKVEVVDKGRIKESLQGVFTSVGEKL
jgi:hypothetical protein